MSAIRAYIRIGPEARAGRSCLPYLCPNSDDLLSRHADDRVSVVDFLNSNRVRYSAVVEKHSRAARSRVLSVIQAFPA